MKRFFNILYFVSLSMLALGQNTQGDSFFFMDAGVNEIIVNTRQEPKIDTVVVIQRDTSVVYEYQEIANKDDAQSPTTILVRNTAYEQRLLGVKEYSYGDTQMDEKALAKFFRDNNRDVYLKYMKNKNIKTAGWSLFGGGLALIFTGGLCHLDYYYDSWYCNYSWCHPDGGYHSYYHSWARGDEAGCALWSIGIASVITSIPLLCVGYANDDKIVKQFNSTRSGTAITLGLTSSKNGIGLALNF